ncbi:hypothetical protein DL738_11680 [Escherichia coli]|nr:hypothetical protein [Salmonella enterica]EGE2353506.1 hypothetical protein [Escherichia coli]EGH2839176.1 hypothetical protein [Salmonella enterica]EHG9741774.1 hypothetical protein [Salmonella enterica]EIV1877142.1 hypothetical protein [Salmonella enterica]
MNTFLYVLVGWIVVLYFVNKVREKRSKPKTVKVLVKRNGIYKEVDAVMMPKYKGRDVSTDLTESGSPEFNYAAEMMKNQNDTTKIEYYSAGSMLREMREFADKQMERRL